MNYTLLYMNILKNIYYIYTHIYLFIYYLLKMYLFSPANRTSSNFLSITSTTSKVHSRNNWIIVWLILFDFLKHPQRQMKLERKTNMQILKLGLSSCTFCRQRWVQPLQQRRLMKLGKTLHHVQHTFVINSCIHVDATRRGRASVFRHKTEPQTSRDRTAVDCLP